METHQIAKSSYMRKIHHGKYRLQRKKYPKFTGSEPCSEYHPEIFYPEIKNQIDSQEAAYVARVVCKDCPLKMECLEWALHHEKYGIWGGTTDTQRKELRVKMKIAYCDPQYIDGYLELQQEIYG